MKHNYLLQALYACCKSQGFEFEMNTTSFVPIRHFLPHNFDKYGNMFISLESNFLISLWKQKVATSLPETEMGSVIQFERLGLTWNAFADAFIGVLHLPASNRFHICWCYCYFVRAIILTLCISKFFVVWSKRLCLSL